MLLTWSTQLWLAPTPLAFSHFRLTAKGVSSSLYRLVALLVRSLSLDLACLRLSTLP